MTALCAKMLYFVLLQEVLILLEGKLIWAPLTHLTMICDSAVCLCCTMDLPDPDCNFRLCYVP